MNLNELMPGDVILFPNQDNLISKTIRLTQGHDFVHVALVCSVGKKDVLLIEIDRFLKVRFIPLSKHSNNKNIVIARNKNGIINKKKILFNSIYLLNLPYAYEQILDGLINHISRFFYKKWKYKHIFAFNVKKRFICSTLVAYILEKSSNIKFDNWEFAEPEDFVKNNWELFSIDK